jgi:carbamoyl-phosphate synthase small subunit
MALSVKTTKISSARESVIAADGGDMQGRLILEDGTVFTGEAFGSSGERSGLVIFYTGVSGHQELLTDPASLGRIVVFGHPHVGNYGVNEADYESDRVCAEGIMVKELSEAGGGRPGSKSFSEFCADRQLIGLRGINTRALIAHIRERGEQWGLITTRETGAAGYGARLSELKRPLGADPEAYRVTGEALLASSRPSRDNRTVVTLDLGAGKSLYSMLKENNFFWRAFGPRIGAAEISAINPVAVIVTDGPYSTDSLGGAVDTLRLLSGKIPIFGIGLGCVVLGAALGARPVAMRSGHHGPGSVVVNLKTGRPAVAYQHHSFNLDEKSLPAAGAKALFRNVNDGTLEGFINKRKKAAGALFRPADLGLLEAILS